MSSILKALKKLEGEKTSYRPEFLNIDAEILRDRNKRSFSATVGVLLALLLFVCGSGATYLYMKLKPATISKKYVVSSSVRHNDTPAETIRFSDEKHPKQSSGVLKKNSNALAIPALPSKPTAKPEIVTGKQNKTTHQSKQNQVLSTSSLPKLPHTTPLLKVNGIAFQPEGSDSVAIVNGVTVSSGFSIEGATVEDIQKDRVLFSFKGEAIEVPLGKSNR